mmetsp:Transcript_126581/g.354416  ORF Transcript_126581/g.354416 Transcript_126581/m.354416 type:complete len:368 (+) Transcript_126581:133-1236(+)|eukprot:CAMPEP_0176216518 /NCGR_PEP_ID=MMETSP0121_2-20121125/17230_1 /TAXON_ID=160619 /ORGANISM="Kryptoperidinium foliaceum, Strain CCMP 1326" /LENGTH=367 /DNA_ID=CAMNT_0017555643 /DNA_START=118 /DNA_END=1221 /DNA_ORIENTATION=-
MGNVSQGQPPDANHALTDMPRRISEKTGRFAACGQTSDDSGDDGSFSTRSVPDSEEEPLGTAESSLAPPQASAPTFDATFASVEDSCAAVQAPQLSSWPPAQSTWQIAARPATKAQESDLLEQFPQGPNSCDEQQNRVRLVSLGCYCGPKLSFQKMGRGAETLPFDWMRTKLDGLLHFMRSDFSGFFDFSTRLPVPDSAGMVTYRGYQHSFWHDDPTDPSMQERYARRIERFMAIDARFEPVLFVRVASHTGELSRAPELLAELGRFGQSARLLLVLNFQRDGQGPALVHGLERLMVHVLPSEAHALGKNFGAPYVEAVRCGIDWVLGRECSARLYPSLEALSAAVVPDDWGKSGLGGLRAFEDGAA